MKKISILFILVLITIGLHAQKKDTVKTASGLKYVQLKAGNGQKPVDGQKVKVYFKGSLQNGKVFESNFDYSPFKFTLGKKEVIPGWDEGFKLMSKGERGLLIVPAKLAYGKKGQKDPDDESKYMIPPDSDLIFEVELVDFK